MKKQYKRTAEKQAEYDAFAAMAKQIADELEEGKHTERVKQIEKDTPGLSRLSVFNQLLVLRQMETATDVHTYMDWQALGYQVREGEKSHIRIVAPRKRQDEESGEQKIAGFHSIAVFDISQCDKMEESQ